MANEQSNRMLVHDKRDVGHFVALHPISHSRRLIMKFLMSALISALLAVSAPAFAGSHGGGKMDDKKMDCSKKENAEKAECKKS
jgi:hypothetical protein